MASATSRSASVPVGENLSLARPTALSLLSTMAQLLVRDIEGEVVRELKVRAARHGRSAEEEHRQILREALRSKGRRSPSRSSCSRCPTSERIGTSSGPRTAVARSSFELPARYQRHLRAAQGGASRAATSPAGSLALAEEEIYLSVLTIGEIRRGVESVRRRDPDSAAALDSWLSRLTEAHRDRILLVDRAIAEEWGRMSVPDPLPVVDGLLAATAKGRRA